MLLWLEDQDDKLYLSNASNAYFHEIRKGYLRHKSNFIIPVAYQVTYDVYQDQFIALFRSDQQHDCLSYEMHLIVDATTTVRDVSALAEAHFGRSR